MKVNYSLIIGTILVIFFINKILNEKPPVQEVVVPIRVKDEVEEGDIQIPIEVDVNVKEDINNTEVEIKKKEGTIGSIDYPETTTITQKLSKLKELLPQPIKDQIDNEPFMIVRNKMNQVMKPLLVKEDSLSPNPIGTTEYRFVDENPKTAWSDINVSQHPEHYKSNFTDELTNSGGFFDNDQFYHDRTSPQSKTNLPDRCFMNKNDEVICSFNNRLQNIPPKLIQDKYNNQVLNSIGQGGGDIFKGVNESNINNVNGEQYQIWSYDNEKTINGGKYYGNVQASSSMNEDYLKLKDISERPNYSI